MAASLSSVFRNRHQELYVDPATCNTQKCIATGNYLKQYMNFNVKPCDDFYEYACGNYRFIKPIPTGSNKMNVIEDTLELIKQLIIQNLKKPRPESPEAVQKARSVFTGCVNSDGIQSLGLLPFSILLKMVGLQLKPPFIGSLETSSIDFGTTIGKVRQFGQTEFPFRITVGVDANDKKYNRLEIRIPNREANAKILRNNVDKNATPNRKESGNQITEKNSKSEYSNVFTRAVGDFVPRPHKRINSTPPEARITKKNLSAPVTRTSSFLEPSANVSGKTFPRRLPANRNPVPGSEIQQSKKKSITSNVAPGDLISQEKRNNEPSKEPNDEITNANRPKNSDFDEYNEPLTNYMMKVANALYEYMNIKLIENKVDLLRTMISEVSELFYSIEKIVDKNVNQNEKDQEFTLQELQEKTNSIALNKEGNYVIDWKALFDALFEEIPEVKTYFTNERKIYIEDMNYFENVIRLLAEANTRTLYSAMWWQIIRSHIKYTTEAMGHLEDEYRNQVGMKVESRDEFCMTLTVNLFDIATLHEFLTGPKFENWIQEISATMRPIYFALKQMIMENKFLSKKTIMAAMHKITTAFIRLVYSPRLNNEDSLNEAFQEVIPQESNLFFTVLFFNRNNTKKYFRRLNQENRNNNYDYQPLLSKSNEFSPQENRADFPLAHVLSYIPFITSGLKSTILGSVGVAIAREEAHSFDTKGNEYSLWGKRKQWWNENTLNAYRKEAECYVQAYEKLCYEEANNSCVDGRTTLEENIADSIAFKAAINAYKQFVKSNGEEPLMTELQTLSNLQVLTLTWANTMCQTETISELENELTKSKYAPPSARVRGVVKNSREFAEIWACPKESEMNPPEKCVLW